MKLRLRVEGMSCMNCVGKVHQALSGMKGVTSVKVDRESSLVEVGGEAKLEDLLKSLKSIGYPGSQIRSETSNELKSQGPNWLASTGQALVVMVILMLGEWVFDWHHQEWFNWTSFALSIVVMGGAGRHFFYNAWNQALRGNANMDTLVSLGSGAAFGISAYGLFRPGILQHLYFLESTAIIALISLGHALESVTTQRAATAVKKLLKEAPAQAFLLTSTGQESEVSVGELKVGNQIAVHPGGRVPVDGILMQGEALLDESMLTGESVSVKKQVGDFVLGGTLNVERLIQLEVRAVGSQTALARIVQLVEEAQQSRASVQRLADRLSSFLVFGVIILSVITVFGWIVWGHATVEQAIIYAVAVLVVACPCAMGLATPAALMVAVSVAARRGVLIRGAEALEKCGRITAVLFDKTGTLTESRGEVEQKLNPRADAGLVASLVKAMVLPSTHPVGRILAEHVAQATPASVVNWQEIRGCGVTAQFRGQTVRLGALPWLQSLGVEVDSKEVTGTGISLGEEYLGTFSVRPRPKAGAGNVVKRLQAQGLRVFMVTGDRKVIAEELASSLQIPLSNVMAEVLPDKKALAVKRLQEKGEKVAFVGDGINDGPALAQADLGLAVMGASDLAREAADIILLRQDIEVVPEILALSGATMSVIKQNFCWALGYNLVAVPIAMAGVVSPILCAAAMGLSDLCVVGNSLRLFLWKAKS